MVMQSKYYQFVNSFSPISEDSFEKLTQISTFQKIKANTPVVTVGQVPQYVYLLSSGIMRAYMIAEDGKQHNKKLFSGLSCVGPLTALIKNSPSELIYETITDCNTYEINFIEFRKLCREHFELGRLYVKILEYIFIEYEQRNLDLMSLNATERYLKLQRQIPDIDSLIPQFQIASYLGVTTVQLSRIRKKIKSAKVLT